MIELDTVDDDTFDALARSLIHCDLAQVLDSRSSNFGDRVSRFRADWGEIVVTRERGVGAIAAGSRLWPSPVNIPYWKALLEGRPVRERDFDWSSQSAFVIDCISEIAIRLRTPEPEAIALRTHLEQLRRVYVRDHRAKVRAEIERELRHGLS